LYRVDELADRPSGFVPENSIGYKSMVPLDEIVAEVKGRKTKSKAVDQQYAELIQTFGSEFNVLLNVSEADLFSCTSSKIAEGIIRVREGNLTILPGYDGEYGTIKLFESEARSQEKENQQFTLF
jgi:PHP family Zn ribbon phosphoesterase